MIKLIFKKIKYIIKLLVIWLLIILFAWTFVDIILSLKGELPLRIQEVFETEFVKGRGYAMRSFTQNYRTYINSYGLRREEIPEPQPDEMHILALGDSTCYSSNTSQENQWPAVIERELRSRGVKATVLNGGVPGYSLEKMLLALKWYIKNLPFKIEVLLIHGSWNNYWNDKPLDPNLDLEKVAKKYFPKFPTNLEPDPRFVTYNQYLIDNTMLRTPSFLKWISLKSPLGNILVKNLWFRFYLPIINRTRNSVEDNNLTVDEKYLIDLGFLIHTAKLNGIKPIMLRQISVLRIPGFDMASAVRDYPLYMAKDYSWMKPRMKRMDEIQDFYVKYGLAELFDPMQDVLKEVNAKNVFHKDTEISYMGSPSHPFDRGSILLGKSISNKLIENKVVSIIEKKPWVHPKENNSVYDLNFTKFNYNWTKNKTIVLFVLILLFEIMGSLALILFSRGRIFFPFPGFNFSIGFLLILFQFYFFQQFTSLKSLAFLFSLILIPILIALLLFFKDRLLLIQISIGKFFQRLVLNIIIIFILLLSFNYITLGKNDNGKQANYRSIQTNAAWMQFSEDMIASKSRLYSAYTNIRKGDKPIEVLDILNYLPAFNAILPNFSLAIHGVFKIRFEDSLLLFNGFPFLYLFSGILFAMRRKKTIFPKLILIIPLLVVVYHFGRISFNIYLQIFSLSVFVFCLLSVYHKKLNYLNGGFILLAISGSFVLILPEIWNFIITLVALPFFYGYMQAKSLKRYTYSLIKHIFLAIFAILFGKMFLFEYLAGTPNAFKFVLAEKILGETEVKRHSIENAFLYISFVIIVWSILSKKIKIIAPVLIVILLLGSASKFLPFQLWINLLFAITCMSIFFIGNNNFLIRFKKRIYGNN